MPRVCERETTSEMSTISYCSRRCEETGDKTLAAGLKAYIATEGVCAGAFPFSPAGQFKGDTPGDLQRSLESVLQ
jgi:hypothetical protein